MGYRTLEERFLADFEKLEELNKSLMVENLQLQKDFSENSENRVLDLAVKVAGRREIVKKVIPVWNRRNAAENNFIDWVVKSSYQDELPPGVSINDFIKYFEDELTEAYEEKYAEDTKEAGK